ncbi:hypothetical protein R1flu_026270 [Riccia fluitans]|uniref:Uncharacterized protein n=1 Tax=Riccia fluitans TaxID=41844 RepID=A0ABD1XFI1_9MARC
MQAIGGRLGGVMWHFPVARSKTERVFGRLPRADSITGLRNNRQTKLWPNCETVRFRVYKIRRGKAPVGEGAISPIQSSSQRRSPTRSKLRGSIVEEQCVQIEEAEGSGGNDTSLCVSPVHSDRILPTIR